MHHYHVTPHAQIAWCATIQERRVTTRVDTVFDIIIDFFNLSLKNKNLNFRIDLVLFYDEKLIVSYSIDVLGLDWLTSKTTQRPKNVGETKITSRTLFLVLKIVIHFCI